VNLAACLIRGLRLLQIKPPARLYALAQAWQTLDSLCALQKRHNDLEGLVSWAKRKKLAPQRLYYTQLLNETADSLFFSRYKYPTLATLTDWVITLQSQLFPTPRYTKGYAKRYTAKR